MVFKIDAVFEPLVLLVIFAVFTYIAMSSMSIIKKYNTILMLLLWMAFLVLIYIGSSGIDANRFSHVNWEYLPRAVPMIIASICFSSYYPNYM